MKFIFRDILPPIMLFAIVFLIPVIFLGQKTNKKRTVPTTVKVAAFCEGVFGVLIFVYSIHTMVSFKPAFCLWLPVEYIFLFEFALAFLWFAMASTISQGTTKSRTVCLIMSIMRIPSIIGIFFSILDIYLLYFTRQSRGFYAQNNKK